MNRHEKDAESHARRGATTQIDIPDQGEDIGTLLDYPSLDLLFRSADAADPDSLPAMRAQFAQTLQDLDRVIRQGTKEDAERAARVVEAYRVTSAFLDTLERLGAESQQNS